MRVYSDCLRMREENFEEIQSTKIKTKEYRQRRRRVFLQSLFMAIILY